MEIRKICYGRIKATELEKAGWEFNKDTYRMTKGKFMLEALCIVKAKGAYMDSKAILSIRRSIDTYEIIYEDTQLTEEILLELINKYTATKVEMKPLDNSWYTKAHYDLKMPEEFPKPYIEKHSEMASGYINGALDFREKTIEMINKKFKGTFTINNQYELLETLIKQIENLQYGK